MKSSSNQTNTRRSYVTTSGKMSKKAVFHGEDVIRQALTEISVLKAKGVPINRIVNNMSSKLKVHRTTVENWLRKERLNARKQSANNVNTKSLVTSSLITGTKSLGIHTIDRNGVTFNVKSGFVKLTTDEVNIIADLRGLFQK